jgi:hypothetical protein
LDPRHILITLCVLFTGTLTGDEGTTPSNTGDGSKAPADSSATDSSVPVGPIVGGVVGGVGGVAIIITLIILFRKKKQHDSKAEANELEVPPEYRSKNPLVHGRTSPGELEDSEPVHILKPNTHPRSWDGRLTELEGQQPQQEYHRGRPVRAPPNGGLTELQ